mgnify:CR=1 FL=1
MKFWLNSKTVWALGLLAGNATATMVDPSMNVGSALAYLVQFGLGMALSHGTDVQKPEIDVAMLGNVIWTIGTAVAGLWARATASGGLKFRS